MLLNKNLQIYLKTTETCNLNCFHCFTSGSKGEKVYFNPSSTFHCISRLVDEYSLESLNIVFHGGEPMLAPLEDIEKIIGQLSSLPLNIQFGLQTNLVYKLTEKKLNFINKYFKSGMGTSWDYNIRFGSVHKSQADNQEKLWEANVKTLVENGHSLTLFVSLNKDLLNKVEPQKILDYAISLGFKYIQFERITLDGNAKLNRDFFPSNEELDNWFIDLYEITIREKKYLDITNMFLGEIAQAFLRSNHVGNRLRSCERSIITINADGSVSGCPNSAKTSKWGNINDSNLDFVKSKKRLEAIALETQRNNECMSCSVKEICNGDCYKLAWDERCPAPKNLMKKIKTEDIKDIEKLLL